MEMDTTQIKGVDSTNRVTRAVCRENARLIIREKMCIRDSHMGAHGHQQPTQRPRHPAEARHQAAGAIQGDGRFLHCRLDGAFRRRYRVMSVSYTHLPAHTRFSGTAKREWRKD